MKGLAIVPARSGSKGLVDKNIRNLAGKPLIHYTLEAAVKSGVFSNVILSTDSDKYAEIAKLVEGVEVPFLRDEKNAGDTSSTWDVVKEVLNKYEQQGVRFDFFCVLQPTSPLRDENNIKEAYELFLSKQADAIISVCQLEHSINTINTLPENHSMEGFLKDQQKYARQMNPTYYRLNGAIYFARVKSFLENDTIYTSKSYAYIMDSRHSIDIDSEDDLELAKIYMA